MCVRRFMAKMPNRSDNNTPNAEDDGTLRVPISERPLDEGAIFLPSLGHWGSLPVEDYPDYDLIDLKVYLDDDPTSEDAILLIRYYDEDEDIVVQWKPISQEKVTDCSDVEMLLDLMIYHPDESDSNIEYCTDCWDESQEDMLCLMVAISKDQIEILQAENQQIRDDWSSVDSIYD